MPDDPDPFDTLRQAWRDQTLTQEVPDMAALAAKTQQFERTIRNRNARELVAVGIVVACFTPLALAGGAHLLTRLGAAEVVLASLFIAFVLVRYGTTTSPPDPSLSTEAFLAAHRHNLRAQARLLHAVPLWYAGPVSLGIVAMGLGRWLQTGSAWVGGLGIGVAVLTFVAVSAVNRQAARALNTQADDLEAEPEAPTAG